MTRRSCPHPAPEPAQTAVDMFDQFDVGFGESACGSGGPSLRHRRSEPALIEVNHDKIRIDSGPDFWNCLHPEGHHGGTMCFQAERTPDTSDMILMTAAVLPRIPETRDDSRDCPTGMQSGRSTAAALAAAMPATGPTFPRNFPSDFRENQICPHPEQVAVCPKTGRPAPPDPDWPRCAH